MKWQISGETLLQNSTCFTHKYVLRTKQTKWLNSRMLILKWKIMKIDAQFAVMLLEKMRPIFPLSSMSICFVFVDALLGIYAFGIGMPSWWLYPFYILECCSLSPFISRKIPQSTISKCFFFFILCLARDASFFPNTLLNMYRMALLYLILI